MNTRLRQSIAAVSLSVLATNAVGAASLSASRQVVVDRPPVVVWKLLGAFNALDVWLPPVVTSTYSGNPTEPGAIRVLHLSNGARVTEELVSYSNAKHSYSYKFLESPLPVKNYVATIEVSETADGRSLVRWNSTFDAAGAPDDKAREAVLGIYDAGLKKVAAIFGM